MKHIKNVRRAAIRWIKLRLPNPSTLRYRSAVELTRWSTNINQ